MTVAHLHADAVGAGTSADRFRAPDAPAFCSNCRASASVTRNGSLTVFQRGTNVPATSAALKPGCSSAMASRP